MRRSCARVCMGCRTGVHCGGRVHMFARGAGLVRGDYKGLHRGTATQVGSLAKLSGATATHAVMRVSDVPGNALFSYSNTSNSSCCSSPLVAAASSTAGWRRRCPCCRGGSTATAPSRWALWTPRCLCVPATAQGNRLRPWVMLLRVTVTVTVIAERCEINRVHRLMQSAWQLHNSACHGLS